MQMERRLPNKVALIKGVVRAICAGIPMCFAKDGLHVAIRNGESNIARLYR